MGFLKKIVKKVKKGIKKIGSGVKKVFKKLKKSKLLKTIAIVGAALVTGGAAVGAFGGSLASSTIGQALIASKNFIMGIPGVSFVAKPFEYAGTMLGTGAGKVTDFLGVTTEAGRLGPDLATQLANVGPTAGQINMDAMNFGQTAEITSYDPLTGQLTGGGFTVPGSAAGQEAMKKAAETAITGASTGAATSTAASTVGSFAREVATGVATSVATGAAMQYIQGEPDPVGAVGAGLGEERGISLTPLEVAYAQSGVDMRDIYSQLTFGTADPGFLASRYGDLYQQPTFSLGG